MCRGVVAAYKGDVYLRTVRKKIIEQKLNNEKLNKCWAIVLEGAKTLTRARGKRPEKKSTSLLPCDMGSTPLIKSTLDHKEAQKWNRELHSAWMRGSWHIRVRLMGFRLLSIYTAAPEAFSSFLSLNHLVCPYDLYILWPFSVIYFLFSCSASFFITDHLIGRQVPVGNTENLPPVHVQGVTVVMSLSPKQHPSFHFILFFQ